MDIFESLEKIGFQVKKFFWPTVFLIVGLYLLKIAVLPVKEVLADNSPYELKQSPAFLYASIFFLLASVVWYLYILDLIKTKIGYVVMAVLAVCSIYLMYTDYTTIKSKVDFDAASDLRDLDIKARMDDLKQAELAYKETNGVYTASMDSLIDFIKTGEKMKIVKKGSIPERKIYTYERDYLYTDDRPIDKFMTEIEAAALSKSEFAKSDTSDLHSFQRDTIYVPVMDAVFLNETRIDARKKMGASLDFHPDSLRYVPHSRIPVTIQVGSVAKSETVKASTIFIKMVHPMSGEMKDSLFYSIGSLTDNHLRESWND
ncbi:MAG: hypothetical protein P8I55_00800 [Crocinitomix sp.]|nr:hypothetical protein [Crocinitomix sp.]